jgi:beta-1,4-mannosyltransferase
MKVIFAPDFRAVAPYQQLLADALADEGVEVSFLTGYRRGLPLTRALPADEPGILHLHWPVYYFMRNTPLDGLRKARYLADLLFATNHRPVVYTAHDLLPLNAPDDALVRLDVLHTFRRATRIIAHSEAAAQEIVNQFRVPRDRIAVIPHGDLAVSVGVPLPRAEARRALSLPDGPVCIAIGSIDPNKDVESLVTWWRAARPDAHLAVVGKADPVTREKLEALAENDPRILLLLTRQTDDEMRAWFSAADCVLINYRHIFTSGVACLARSMGVPVVIRRELHTIDLMEPHPLVFRYGGMDEDFGNALAQALAVAPDFGMAADWRAATDWGKIARMTAAVYADAERSIRPGTHDAGR